MEMKTCANCKWYTEDAEVCVNDASDHLADFVAPDDGCEAWEEKDKTTGTFRACVGRKIR